MCNSAMAPPLYGWLNIELDRSVNWVGVICVVRLACNFLAKVNRPKKHKWSRGRKKKPRNKTEFKFGRWEREIKLTQLCAAMQDMTSLISNGLEKFIQKTQMGQDKKKNMKAHKCIADYKPDQLKLPTWSKKKLKLPTYVREVGDKTTLRSVFFGRRSDQNASTMHHTR